MTKLIAAIWWTMDNGYEPRWELSQCEALSMFLGGLVLAFVADFAVFLWFSKRNGHN